MNIILFGPPGAGKGTQSKFLVKQLNNFQISTGDMLRNEIQKNSEIGKKIVEDMSEGRFVSDEIVNSLIENVVFDSKKKNKLIIPDLYGFGFCPRSSGNKYGFKYLMKHLNSILNHFSNNQPIGVIGASMGGALALELARQNPKKVNKLLLLSPAGLAGKNPKIPWPFNHLGAFFLSRPFVRRGLCKQAFADPTNSVGPAEEQIASIHLKVPGWQSSLADFAADGGVSGCGLPKPTQPLKIILGKYDRIIPKNEKEETYRNYNSNIEIALNSGHLPHLEEPKLVADAWGKLKK